MLYNFKEARKYHAFIFTWIMVSNFYFLKANAAIGTCLYIHMFVLSGLRLMEKQTPGLSWLWFLKSAEFVQQCVADGRELNFA